MKVDVRGISFCQRCSPASGTRVQSGQRFVYLSRPVSTVPLLGNILAGPGFGSRDLDGIRDRKQ